MTDWKTSNQQYGNSGVRKTSNSQSQNKTKIGRTTL